MQTTNKYIDEESLFKKEMFSI